MSIITTLLGNFTRRRLTSRPGQFAEPPSGYRGTIQHATDLCTGCGTCVYVCSPGAITIDDDGESRLLWQFDAGQCTFCGRCVQHCPTNALSFLAQATPMALDRETNVTRHEVFYVPCAACGKPITSLPAGVVPESLSTPDTDELAEGRQLCPACRKRLASERIKLGYMGQRKSDD